ncbi:unnamed protein product [Mytilus coruscus]|uniref:Uncharacterized protein n=1 Tax=Mytilus coruscus TaxID=42192 RepID=A0A6J8E2J1_MYTCO|nr:unnamed protein product [Mytilus coruscus]
MNNVRDNLTSTETFISITSGGLGEEIVMRGCDLDVMELYKNIEISEDTKIHFKPFKAYLKIKTEDIPPGFTELRLVHSYFCNVNEVCVEVDDEYYFSNKRLKDLCNKNNLEIEHGPCLSDKNGILDLALCLRSKSWIPQANQWIIRSNNLWPGYNVKETIIKHGVLFVPCSYVVERHPKSSVNLENEIHMVLSIENSKMKNFYAHYLSKMGK